MTSARSIRISCVLALLAGCKYRDNPACPDDGAAFGVGDACVSPGLCGAGMLECAGPFITRCSSEPGGSESRAAPEICDGEDNDCNGLVDDGLPVGVPCEAGIGACRGSGVLLCDAARAALVCSAATGASEAESCDRQDNDCDGETDEDFALGTPCRAGSECAGIVECDESGAARCSTEPGGGDHLEDRKEIDCDGQDNDCDNEVDEDQDPETVCECPVEEWPILEAPAEFHGGAEQKFCDTTRCERLSDGSAWFEYCLADCTEEMTETGEIIEKPFAGCDIATGELSSFDPFWTDPESRGGVEVSFCVDGTSAEGELRLWYGEHPERRWVPLIPAARALPAGCYVQYYAPEQVKTPDWIASPKCRGRCGDGTSTDPEPSDADACHFPTELTAPEGWSEDDGWAARVSITAEGCVGEARGSVRILSLRMVASECRCSSDEDCRDPDRSRCHGLSEARECPLESSRGVCGPETASTLR